ncbi:unnamed protein product [Caenorhabditis auriculariae]|uniref:Transcription initiation factor TFIID subunit 8 n=1 Tax=Caenorhabditis auriculariae TaxID=2777116 RepID=A0A8S1HS41_9PELO|nr:unnamed protein product [Caenorhabditis auriculariae]
MGDPSFSKSRNLLGRIFSHTTATASSSRRSNQRDRIVFDTAAHFDEGYHQVIKKVAIVICKMAGFDDLENAALETLSVLFHRCLKQIAEQARHFCEVSGRTKPSPADVLAALANTGLRFDGIPEFFYHQLTQPFPSLRTPSLLPVASKRATVRLETDEPHPQYVFSWMPPFPNAHTYIRTDICDEPDISYEKVRETMAVKSRNAVRSFVNHWIRSLPSFSLFQSFEQVISESVDRMINQQTHKARRTESFFAFRSLLGRDEIENEAANREFLIQNGLITEESDLELAVLCRDGTIIDTSGKRVVVGADVEVEMDCEDADSSMSPQKLKSDYDVEEMLNELDRFQFDDFDEKFNELDALKQKWILEYLPEWCHVLEPSYEHLAYLKAADQESEKSKNDQTNDDTTDLQPTENPYFMPPVLDET